MKFEIKSYINGAVLFSLETDSMKLCVEAAIKSRANLSRAYLSGANLSGAYLSGAYLSGAYLSGANLSGAYLSGANLSVSNLYRADLSVADLSRADLYGANLYGADLYGADLYGADLSRADLSRAKDINKYLCTPLMLLLDQPGEICLYKIVNEKDDGIYNGGLKYITGETVAVENASTTDTEQCAAGINVATLDWCMREWRSNHRILKIYFTADDIACIPIATDGKIRLHRCRVGEEVNLKKIGLIKDDAPVTGD